MLGLGPHGGFIAAAYAAVALVMAGLIVWILGDARAQRRALAALEAEGVTRRSARRRPAPADRAKKRRKR